MLSNDKRYCRDCLLKFTKGVWNRTFISLNNPIFFALFINIKIFFTTLKLTYTLSKLVHSSFDELNFS